VWLVAPEPTTELVTGMVGAGALELKQLVRDYGSHSVNHSVESGNYYGGARGRGRGGRGGVNEGPTYCRGKTYWGAVKVCCADQDGPPPCTGHGRMATTELRPWMGRERSPRLEAGGVR
jgi:hypothetical protein